jgi:Insect cuticle protein
VLLLCAAGAPTALALAGYGRDIPTIPGIDYERAARLKAAPKAPLPPPPPPPPPPAPRPAVVAAPIAPARLAIAPAVVPAAAALTGPPQPYSFAYEVIDPAAGLNYGQEERSDAAGVVTGEYRVLLPDGRTQVVR